MTEHPRETGLPAAAMAVIAPMAIRSLKTMRHPEKDSFRGDTAIRAPSAEPSGLKELTETPIYPACGERVCTTRRSRRGSGIEMDTSRCPAHKLSQRELGRMDNVKGRFYGGTGYTGSKGRAGGFPNPFDRPQVCCLTI